MPALSSFSSPLRILRALALGLSLAAASQAAAQDTGRPRPAPGSGQTEDAPIPYPEDTPSPPRRALPYRSQPTPPHPEETWIEEEDREISLASLDDPNIGLTFEWVAGLALIDSSRGQGGEPRFGWGLRFTWEFGRTLASEAMRDAWFADLTWTHVEMREGTANLFAHSSYNYFTAAPAYEFTFGRGSPFGFYLQAGVGVAMQAFLLHSEVSDTGRMNLQPLLQYGAGFRATPRLSANAPWRLSFRLETTRFRRAYMDDTFLGGSIGAAF